MPTILVAYVEDNYSTADVKIVSINSMQKDFDVVAAVDLDFAVDKNIIIARFERMLAAKQREIDDIQEKMEYFKNNFKAFWVKMERPTEEVTL